LQPVGEGRREQLVAGGRMDLDRVAASLRAGVLRIECGKFLTGIAEELGSGVWFKATDNVAVPIDVGDVGPGRVARTPVNAYEREGPMNKDQRLLFVGSQVCAPELLGEAVQGVQRGGVRHAF